MSLQLWLVSPVRQGHTQPVGGKKTLPAFTDCSSHNAANKQHHYPCQFVGQHLSYVVHQRNDSVIIDFVCDFLLRKICGIDKGQPQLY